MADYTIILKDREEVAEETMAFHFDITGTGYTQRLEKTNPAFTFIPTVTTPNGQNGYWRWPVYESAKSSTATVE